MKRILIGIVAVVVLIVGGLAAYLSSTDFTEYRGLIAREVKAATGRDFKVNGAFGLKVFSTTPSLRMTDVSFGNAKWAKEPAMMTAKRVDAQVRLLPLLTGDVVVKRVVIHEPKILFETDAKGRGNWNVQAMMKEGGSAKIDPDSVPTIQQIRILGADVRYRDGKTGRIMKMTIEETVARMSTNKSPIVFDFKGTLNDAPVLVKATLGSIARLVQWDKPWPVEIDADIGKSKLVGKGETMIGQTPMYVRMTLNSDHFDMKEFTQITTGATQRGRMFNTEPLPLAALHAFDAEATLTVKTLTGAGPKFSNLKAEATVRDGTARLKPVLTTMAGGKVRGAITLRDAGKAGALDIDLKLDKADLGQLLTQMTGQATLTGVLNADIELSGTGISMAGMLGTSKGHIRVASGRGDLNHQFFGFLSKGVLEAVTPWSGGGKVKVICTVNNFDVRNGIASGISILDTNRVLVRGNGSINLGKETVNFVYNPITKDTSLLSVAALVPIRVTGTISNPKAAADVGAALTNAPGAVVGVVEGAAAKVGNLLGIGGSSSGGSSSGGGCGVLPASAGGTSGDGKAATGKKPEKKDGGVLEGVKDGIKGIFKD